MRIASVVWTSKFDRISEYNCPPPVFIGGNKMFTEQSLRRYIQPPVRVFWPPARVNSSVNNRPFALHIEHGAYRYGIRYFNVAGRR